MAITAQYRTECFECGYQIEPGELIEPAGAFQWQHATCPDDQPEPATATPCTSCNLVHAEECF